MDALAELRKRDVGSLTWALAALVGLGTFALGLIGLPGRRRSYDERVTIRTATESVSAIWHAARRTEAPHLAYYLMMKPWLAAFGVGNVAARFPSVVAAGLAALFLTVLGTVLFDRLAGVVAGVVLGTASFTMQFAQWARGYTLALLFVVLASLAFVRAVAHPRVGWALAWAVAVVVACWINLFAISIVFVHFAAYALVRPRPRPRLAGAALILVVAAVTPIVVLVATADNGQLNWIPEPTARRVLLHAWDWSSRNPLLLVAAALGVVTLVRAAAAAPAKRWRAVLVVGWTLAPFVLTLALSLAQPAFDAHYLLTGAAGLALLVGAGVYSLPTRYGLALFGLVAAVGALQLAHYYVAPGRPFSSLF